MHRSSLARRRHNSTPLFVVVHGRIRITCNRRKHTGTEDAVTVTIPLDIRRQTIDALDLFYFFRVKRGSNVLQRQKASGENSQLALWRVESAASVNLARSTFQKEGPERGTRAKTFYLDGNWKWFSLVTVALNSTDLSMIKCWFSMSSQLKHEKKLLTQIKSRGIKTYLFEKHPRWTLDVIYPFFFKQTYFILKGWK